MDTSGFSQIGRYDDIVTSFGIDDEELSFGSATTCSVRLYYPDVDSLHCKIVFEQYKAFIAIHGESGVLVDGCKVYPKLSNSNQTVIPLSNNSEFEIHSKRFRFTYPPKEVRKALYATPARPPQRSLRLSMIHSAQVFSPRPSQDPRENLRILQSPLKNPSRSPQKSRNPSPLKAATIQEEEEEEEIVLAQTNYPRVVEEEKDLVILEDIPVQLLSPTKPASDEFPVIQAPPQPPRTPPRRKSLGGTALHRAVLIRSAQRAVLKAEKEREEEEEEMEVLGAVVGEEDDGRNPLHDEGEDEEDDVEMRDADDDGTDEEENEEEEEKEREAQNQKPLWRKSLERIMPWSLTGGSKAQDEGETAEHESEEDISENEEPAPLPLRSLASATPGRRTLGSFMTPQPQAKRGLFPKTGTTGPTAQASAVPGRFSLGGGEARRVIVQQPWKVRDLVLPAPPGTSTSTGAPQPGPLVSMDPPSSLALGMDPLSPIRGPGTPMRPGSDTRSRPTPSISEEERKAIQERRRSAVKELTINPFWAGGAPGMSPSKSSSGSEGPASSSSSSGSASSSLPSSRSISPTKSSSSLLPQRTIFGSPTKGRPLAHAIAEEDDDMNTDNKADKSTDDELDTHGLLEKMKETVDNMKRRRSVVLGGAGSVLSTPKPAAASGASRMSLGPGVGPSMGLGPTAGVTPTIGNGGIKKLDFTKIGTPARAKSRSRSPSKEPSMPAGRGSTPKPLFEDDADKDKAEAPFSLLRPGAIEERRQTILAAPPAEEEEEVVPVLLPVVFVNAAYDDEEKHAEAVKKPAERSRSRSLRTPVETATQEESDAEMEEADVGQKKTARSKPPSKTTAKVPVVQKQNFKTPGHSVDEEDSVLPRSAATARRTRKASAEPEEPVVAPARRGRKAATEPPVQEEENDDDVEVEQEKKAHVKRGRKPRSAAQASEVDEELEAVEPTPAPVKRGRPRKNTATEESSASTQDEAAPTVKAKPPSKNAAAAAPTSRKPASKSASRVRGAGSRAKAAMAAADEDEEDPLDSYDVGSKGTSRKIIQSAEDDDDDADLPAPPPPRTTGPATATKPKPKPKATSSTRKKVAVTKQDEEQSSSTEDNSGASAARVGRSAKANTTAGASRTPAITPATKTATAKTRGRAKTPATAPAATSSTVAGAEKENAPGGSGTSEKVSDAGEDAPVKLRVSRSKGTAAAATRKVSSKAKEAKVDEDEDDSGSGIPTKVRATRVMRTRTKTG